MRITWNRSMSLESSASFAVRSAVARRVGRDVAEVYPWLTLDGDLDLTPLELVLISLDIEELHGTELPTEELAGIETVGELCAFVAQFARQFAGQVARDTGRDETPAPWVSAPPVSPSPSPRSALRVRAVAPPRSLPITSSSRSEKGAA